MQICSSMGSRAHWTVSLTIKLNLYFFTFIPHPSFHVTLKWLFCLLLFLVNLWMLKWLREKIKFIAVYVYFYDVEEKAARQRGREEKGFWKSILKLCILLPFNIFVICINFFLCRLSSISAKSTTSEKVAWQNVPDYTSLKYTFKLQMLASYQIYFVQLILSIERYIIPVEMFGWFMLVL